LSNKKVIEEDDQVYQVEDNFGGSYQPTQEVRRLKSWSSERNMEANNKVDCKKKYQDNFPGR
jgi:hypothetical protein